MSKLCASTLPCARSSALLIQGWTIASSSFSPSFCSIPSMRFGAEDAHQVVLQRQEELRTARIALAARAAAELVVDAPALVALRADDAEAAGGESACAFSRATSSRIACSRRCALRPSATSDKLLTHAHVDIAAELDVGAATGHVGGDGDGARHAGLRDDIGLLLVVARVQDREDLACRCAR